MQPPRARRPRTKPSFARFALPWVIDLGALVIAALAIRCVIASVVGFAHPRFAELVGRVTDPLVWPLGRIPGAATPLVGTLSPADVGTLALILLVWSMLVGVMVGWEAESQR